MIRRSDPSTVSWLGIALRWRGSVIPTVMPRTLICGVFAAFVSLLHFYGLPVHMPILASVIPNVVLGLMLVFRTNTAYERFWEGRRLWGGIISSVRNLSRQIWVGVQEKSPKDRAGKVSALYLLVAFAIATKLHLRQETLDAEIEMVLPSDRLNELKMLNNPPLEIALWIQDYLQQQQIGDRLSLFHLTAMQQHLNVMVESLSGCERIIRTPIPLAYAIHLKQLLLIYCFTIPFQFVKDLGPWTAPVVMLVAFTLFGIEAIGLEIENPFGRDANDLPLDTICETMKRNIDDLVQVSPVSPKLNLLQEELSDF
ncbi:MAG: hypothetical protein MUF49_19555 [Oculatellaceae cyanobacterium Prado106]|jgi:putative membrane protein|nr:hypothetical protein [Oculatellaceae cyanobacterium Prado106]